ncbi:MAG: transcriptional regulator, LysR family [Betaproteobacteria bacterium]|jgi:DNA-binding transcriptional LysR family regulator|nr:transcriptional regulator, LysR family [Betaproteobacteria bacterium]
MTTPKIVTPHHLIALASVASSGSLTAASTALGKTQPAVSAQLKQLSDAVGTPLVTRHRYGVTLTPAAETLLPYAQACVRALEGAELALRRLRGLEEGTLRVLASTSVAVYLLPPVLAAFHARFPAIELRMTRHNAEEAMSALKRGEGDIALVRGPASELTALGSNFVIRTLVRDETMLVVSRRHSLARRRKVRVEQLDGIEIVSREPGSATRALVERMAMRANINFKVKFQTVGVEALKEAILQGFGAGFLSRLAVQREVEAGTLSAVHIDAPELMQHITIAYPALGQSPPAVQKLVEILRSPETYDPKSRLSS